MDEVDREKLWREVGDITGSGGSCEGFAVIVRKYQGNAQALEPEVAAVTQALLGFAASKLARRDDPSSSSSSSSGPRQELEAACGAVYELCAARGVKATVRAFPHAVRDLEAVAETLASLDPSLRGEAWRTRYTLLLWLGMLAKNPFDVETSVGAGRESFLRVVRRACEASLGDAGPARDAAAYCLSSVLTRRDVPPAELEALVGRLEELVGEVAGAAGHETVLAATGTLRAVATALETGARARSRAVARRALEAVAPCFGDDRPPAIRPLRRLAVKVVGRCGCALLRPRVAAWCYARGRRSLAIAEVPSSSPRRQESSVVEPAFEETEPDGPEDEEAAELLEEVVDRLLEGVRDAETTTRWTAAKAIARVVARLSREVADDAVACVLDDARGVGRPIADDDARRHGACLALAELARLGVLLPARLGEAVEALETCVRFDRRTASGSVGAHVRDAACYVAWALARAYDPTLVSPAVPRLVEAVLVVAVLDREVHVRRAASAALQENVGRQGNVPMGIELVHLTDYFTLGSRERAYLEVAPSVARLSPAYADAVLTRVLDDRLCHWDPAVRNLAAKACGAIVADDSLLFDRAMTHLAPRATEGEDVERRHGALLGVSETVLSRAACDSTTAAAVARIVSEIQAAKKRHYRGRGSELVRVAVCRAIAAVARRKGPLDVEARVSLLGALDECVVHPVDDVRDAAVPAFRSFCATYFAGDDDDSKKKNPTIVVVVVDLATRYVADLAAAQTPAATRGLARCVGAIPLRILASNHILDEAIDVLCRRAHRDDLVSGERDAETRRDALSALAELCGCGGGGGGGGGDDAEFLLYMATPARARRVFETYVEACRDYGVDKRGDVGSWARVAALRAAAALAETASRASYPAPSSSDAMIVPDAVARAAAYLGPAAAEELPPAAQQPPLLCFWTPAMAHSLVDVALRQLGEKLDVVRNEAETVLRKLLCSDDVASVPRRGALRAALFSDDRPRFFFEALTRAMAAAPTYLDSCLGGLAVTAGSGDSKASDEARKALLSTARDWAKKKNLAAIARLARSLVAALADVCFFASKKKEPRRADDDPEAKHRASATAAALSREEAARAYVPLLRLAASLVDSTPFRGFFVEPAPTDRFTTPGGENLEVVDHDDDDSIASVLVTTLARVAASRRCATDVRKTRVVADALLAAVSLQAPRNARKAAASVLSLLALPMPRARAHVSEQLYARLVELGLDDHHRKNAFSPDQLRAAQDRLETSIWDDDAPLDKLRIQVDVLADDLGIRDEVARLVAILDTRITHRAAAAAKTPDELESYASLIRDAGY
ncbi:hypothetical protein CTAYLR_005747 [Chrysophaeum taylorii]|uniref:Tubulin-specific chaperone D n=1 Tax=Chrysophaeum taylorii TaxID=2483200 RepID=A0AAD7XN53_9STRA|nr:hypothetical protein CTAYLR_005747 [Chrysophaeum taylorii]